MKRKGYYLRSSITADDIFEMNDITIRMDKNEMAWLKDENRNYVQIFFNQYGQASYLQHWPGMSLDYVLDVFVRHYNAKFLANFKFQELAEQLLIINPTVACNTIELMTAAFKESTDMYLNYVQQNFEYHLVDISKEPSEEDKEKFIDAVRDIEGFPFKEDFSIESNIRIF